MKICRYNQNQIGIVKDGLVFDVTACLGELPSYKYPLPRVDPMIAALPRLMASFEAVAARSKGVSVESVQLLSPVASPGKIVAAPVNYRTHLEEARADKAINFGNEVQDILSIGAFLKAPSALVGPSEGVAIRHLDRRNDHEIELVAVIGKIADRVTAEHALEYVIAYTIGLDMTVRGTEDRSLRKSIDSYAVLGPWMVTADELDGTADLALRLSVNGEVKQSDRTSNMIMSVADLIALVSSYFTLHPGDLLFTGTPMGVGPVRPGDLITAEIENIGAMAVGVRQA
jgi:2,4-didehydro-3-deoxy-L-rhamnonate hydrolase